MHSARGGKDTGAFETRSFLHRTERGELRLSIPAPSVFVFEYQGYTDASFIRFIEAVWDRELSDAPFLIQCFADTAGQTGYTSDFRTGMMIWSKRMIDKTDEYVLLVKSRWVAMGIAIVRSTLGMPGRHLDVSYKRDRYESKLDAAVRRSLARYAQAS